MYRRYSYDRFAAKNGRGYAVARLRREDAEILYAGGAPVGGCKRLATLRHWLVSTYPDRDELGEPGESKESAISAPALAVRCPSCGQAMRLHHTIQPTGRCQP